MGKKLNPEILSLLHERTGKAEATFRKEISLMRKTYPKLTSNAAAHLIAQRNNTSILQKLDVEDRNSLEGITISINNESSSGLSLVPKKKNARKKKLPPIIDYNSNDYFVNEHLDELNRAYHSRCYTSVIILARKIIENLIIDILRKKFPTRRELIYNNSQHRYHDFSIVLDNLYSERNSFTHDGKKAISRLNQLIKPFKKDANDKTHSWFHIVKSPSEIENIQLHSIIELIVFLEKEVGIK
jgi:hypothetical protein